jgi:hypothetical protein
MDLSNYFYAKHAETSASMWSKRPDLKNHTFKQEVLLLTDFSYKPVIIPLSDNT